MNKKDTSNIVFNKFLTIRLTNINNNIFLAFFSIV